MSKLEPSMHLPGAGSNRSKPLDAENRFREGLLRDLSRQVCKVPMQQLGLLG